jgi:response regulator RpfG family c-di-GMP phosphodiesterase
VQEILVDIYDYEKSLSRSIENIHEMESTQAIRSLAFLFSFATGYNKQSHLLDVTAATLLMDLPLVELSERDVMKAILEPAVLSPSLSLHYQKHPAKAHFTAEEKFKKITENTLQMILNHHELHNGKGFPRKTFTKKLPDLAKILSLAVDCYEHWQRAEWKSEKKNLRMVLASLINIEGDENSQRHDLKILKKIHQYFNWKFPIEEITNK